MRQVLAILVIALGCGASVGGVKLAIDEGNMYGWLVMLVGLVIMSAGAIAREKM